MMILKVLKKELKENLGKKRIIITAIMVVIVVMFAVLFLSYLLSIILSSSTSALDFTMVTTLIICLFPIMIIFGVMRAIFQDVVFVEKLKKGCENLLATPMSINDLILGKALFIFLYTYSLILVLMLIFLGILSIDKIPYSLPYSLVYLLAILPITLFALIVIFVSITFQDRSGQQILQVLVFGIMGVISGVFYVSPYIVTTLKGLPYLIVFIALFLGIAIILAAIAHIVFRKIDKEKIILTS